jgi:hypothetical protein
MDLTTLPTFADGDIFQVGGPDFKNGAPEPTEKNGEDFLFFYYL